MTRGGHDMATETKPRTPGGNRPQPASAQPRGSGGTVLPGQSRSAQRPKLAERPKPADRAKPADRPQPGKRPVSSPRHTRPSRPLTTPGHQQPREQARPPAQSWRPRPAQQRMPFILLLVGLLGGALVSLLVISTTLDEGTYRINTLTQQNAALFKDEQMFGNQLNEDRNPATIEREAYALGMRPDRNLRFVDLQTGKISTSLAVAP
ncbi:MAG TPA: hypothetical protein VN969_27825 [Streptosporangiaceae bacterium]|nr:hypothetical protein [Streptosporangiaceae bacterium]